jgi:hypothetical protein
VAAQRVAARRHGIGFWMVRHGVVTRHGEVTRRDADEA